MSTETKAAPASNVLTLAEKVHRDIVLIENELTAVKADFVGMEAKNRDYDQARHRALVRLAKLEKDWKRDNPDDPFDPTAYAPPAIVPPPDSEHGRRFWLQHYRIAALAKELDEAKLALVGA